MRAIHRVACASVAAALLASLPFVACASHHDGSAAAMDASGDVAFDRITLDAPLHPDASCLVTIDTPPLVPGSHVPIGSPITWTSNPPSSGPHYAVWAAFKAYDTPVDRGYYVHDLEHGAIVLLYDPKRCAADGCAAVKAALQQVSDAIPDDPLCASSGVRVRTVITPDPLIDAPIAAASWGWTYTAECLDVPTLKQFALDHYGQSPEQLCANGQAQF